MIISLSLLTAYGKNRGKIDYAKLMDEFRYVPYYETSYKDNGIGVPVGINYRLRKQRLSDAKKERNNAFSMAKKSVGKGIDNFIPNKRGLKVINEFTKKVLNSSVHINDDGRFFLRKPGNILEIGGNVLLDEGRIYVSDFVDDIDTGNKALNTFVKEAASCIKSSDVAFKDGKIKPRLAYGKSVRDIDCGFANISFDGSLIYNNGFHETAGLGVSRKIGAYNAGIKSSIRFDGINGLKHDGLSFGLTRKDKKVSLDSKASIRKRGGKFEADVKLGLRF